MPLVNWQKRGASPLTGQYFGGREEFQGGDRLLSRLFSVEAFSSLGFGRALANQVPISPSFALSCQSNLSVISVSLRHTAWL